MKIKSLNLTELLNKTQVLYSVAYTGEYKAPVDLLENLLETVDTDEPFVYGLIFLQKIKNNSYIIIDGTKRLISLSLLLHAICECFKLTKKQQITASIKEKFIFSEKELKLQLNGQDKYIYEKLIKYEKLTDEEKESSLFKTLHSFWAKIKMDNIPIEKILKLVKQINAIVCICDETEVQNRDIYQYLNCNNPLLDETALITDFIKEQTDIKYWNEIIELFKKADMTRKFRYFLVDYLTIQKNGIVPNENEIYMSFKRYYIKALKSGKTPAKIFESLKNFAKYYIKISTANFENKEIKKRIQTIKDNNMYITFPYLLEITDEYMNKKMPEETYCKMLDNVILFVAEQRSGNFESIINYANLQKTSEM